MHTCTPYHRNGCQVQHGARQRSISRMGCVRRALGENGYATTSATNALVCEVEGEVYFDIFSFLRVKSIFVDVASTVQSLLHTRATSQSIENDPSVRERSLPGSPTANVGRNAHKTVHRIFFIVFSCVLKNHTSNFII